MLRLLVFSVVFCHFQCVSQTANPGFLTGETIGPLPYLEYGPGDDRLGGAKMVFLDTNIVLKVVDSTKDDYIVQLSKNHIAYTPKAFFVKDSIQQPPAPYYLTNNWRVFGDSAYDYVTILLDERLPYKGVQQINPSRLVVDIYGATTNTNWITQLATTKEIKNAYYEQPEDDVFRVVIELNHPQHWGYSIYYEEKKLVIRIKRQPETLDLSKLKVAVDAGHGGDNGGAGGVTSRIAEKTYTLLFARQLEKALQEEGATVFMTRTKDTSLSMVDRVLMLRQEQPNFLISIHLNSSDKDTVQGVSTYYRYIGFRPLTQFILKRMQELGLKEYGNVGNFNFGLNGPTDYPNCLVEVAFLSNKEDEKKILNLEFHRQVAEKIVAGIKDWLQSMR